MLDAKNKMNYLEQIKTIQQRLDKLKSKVDEIKKQVEKETRDLIEIQNKLIDLALKDDYTELDIDKACGIKRDDA